MLCCYSSVELSINYFIIILVSGSLPVYVSHQDVTQHPQLSGLLQDLTKRITNTGCTKATHTNLMHATATLKHARWAGGCRCVGMWWRMWIFFYLFIFIFIFFLFIYLFIYLFFFFSLQTLVDISWKPPHIYMGKG